jgi:hypothetical protein
LRTLRTPPTWCGRAETCCTCRRGICTFSWRARKHNSEWEVANAQAAHTCRIG